MKVFLTGGTGFIGGAVVRRLRERGDEVVAMVRAPGSPPAAALAATGVELLQGDLGDAYLTRAALETADAVIHSAAVYEIGIPPERRAAMYDANVGGTERILGCALEVGVPKAVYVSTVAAFGDTGGTVVDESYEHSRRYTSYYDETKHLAHLAARNLVDKGLPCVVVQPGAVYGPGDHSQVGNLIGQFLRGRLPFLPFGSMGLTFVHRDDVADGIVRALDAGRPGESYVLGGEVSTLRGLFEALATVTGRRAPRFELPVALLKAVAPIGPYVAPLLGYPPNVRELVSSSDGVTFWASSDKAVRELGYTPRPLEQGLRDTLLSEGRLR